uniref:FYVE-type domain-containing protein n=1 Tax=Rhabditophanes sp. KR3021 TaxID=114890 RepID=A0AC35U6C9_9BILA
MQSLLKLVRKPRIDDWSPLAKFYYADEALNGIAGELDSFDGRRDPERCNQLVHRLRQAQDRLLHIIYEMIAIVFPNESDRASRDYRVKFPDEIVHDNLPGQLWFGAECLAAGSNIIDHELESENIRPLAKNLTKHLDQMREMLKDQSLRDPLYYSDKMKASLKMFDHLFAEFEFHYVSAMVPVKSEKEYDCQLDTAVLFSETLTKAIHKNYITEEQIDFCDPSVMFAIPRLAIVWGLLYYNDGALNVDKDPQDLSEMFRSYHHLLLTMRSLLRDLSSIELRMLEERLVSGESNSPPEGSAGNSTNHTETSPIDELITVLPNRSTMIDVDSLHVENLSITNEIAVPTTSVNKRSRSNSSRGGKKTEDVMAKKEGPETDIYNEVAARARQLYKDRNELIHRLFVCIAGVADQLQTNYSQDVRKLLKLVLQPNEVVPVYEINGKTALIPENEEETGVRWVPDTECDQCTQCHNAFTIVRRRHHCRNCGRIFCGRCSSNSLSLPELGYDRKVRVCNLCYLYKLNPFVENDEGPGNELTTDPSISEPEVIEMIPEIPEIQTHENTIKTPSGNEFKGTTNIEIDT